MIRFLVSIVFVLSCAGSLRAQVPAITTRPLSKIARAGEAVSFAVAATGAQPLSYQWRRNGQLIAGANTATLNLASVASSDRGWYQVIVSNAEGSAMSVAMLNVGAPNASVFSLASNTVVSGVSDAVAVEAGSTEAVALRADGTAVAWNLAHPLVRTLGGGNLVGVTTNDVNYGLRADGSVITWDSSGTASAVAPDTLTSVVAFVVGRYTYLALKADGTVVQHSSIFISAPPAGLRDVVSVAMGRHSAAALKADGTVVGWGDGYKPPTTLSDVIAISAFDTLFIALKSDGSVVTWNTDSGVSTPPAETSSQVTAVAGGYLALRSGGTVVGWGYYPTIPAGTSNVSDVGRGGLLLLTGTAPTVTTHPLSTAVTVGDYLTLNVAAAGTPALAYQWKKNGVALANDGRIRGATTATLVIDGVTGDDAANYTVEVSNAFGTRTSNPGTLSVLIPPTITARPLSRLVTVGQSVTFTIGASDHAPLSYQWKRNGAVIAGATGGSLVLPSVTMADRGYYEVLVSNGTAVAYSVFALHVSPLPTAGCVVATWGSDAGNATGVLTPPAGLINVVALAAGPYHAVALKADGTVAAWGASSSGATNVPAGLRDVVAVSASYSQTLALKADGTLLAWGTSAEAVNTAGVRRVASISSRGGHLALKSDGTVAALFGDVPAGLRDIRAIAAGMSFSLTLGADGRVTGWGSVSSDNPQVAPAGLANVVAIGTGDAHSLAIKADGTVVAWGRNDIGQASVPAGLDNVVAVTGGFVHSLALRSDGSVVGWGRNNEGQVSGTARVGGAVAIAAGSYFSMALIPAGAPSVPLPPASRTANIGDTVTLSVRVAGAPLPTIQWRRNGVNIPGATSPTLTLANAQAGDAGAYTVVVTNSNGSVISSAGTLTIVPPLAVTSRPRSRLVPMGERLTLRIVAPGATSYRWKRNGRVIDGATTDILDIPAVTLADRGRYEVLATNAEGGTGSAVAYVNVAAAPTSVVGWGINPDAGIPSRYAPPDLTDIAQISASLSARIALRGDGRIVGWGQSVPSLPSGVSDAVAIALGGSHIVVLKSDGTVMVSGTGGYGEQDVPAGLTDVVAVSAYGYNSVALRADGTIVRWGYGGSAVPAGLNNVVAIAAGAYHVLALRSDGTVVALGGGSDPTNVSPFLNDAIAISASYHSLVLRADGTVVSWGGRYAVPTTLSGVRAIAADNDYSVALKSDGSVVGWGRSDVLPVPTGMSNVIDVAPGLAWLNVPPVPATIQTQPASRSVAFGQTTTLTVAATGTPVVSYQWRKNGENIWDTGGLSGTLTPTLTLANVQAADAGSYTVVVANAYGTVTSAPATLTVTSVSVSAQSTPVAGGSVVLAVNAPAGVSYQWRYLGSPIAGATGATLTLSSLSRGQNGDYDVVLTNGGSTTVAHAYTLDVRPAVMPDYYQADTGFGPRFERTGAGSVLAAVPLGDGRFLVGGDFTRLGSSTAPYLARLNADGTIDGSFVPPILDGAVRTLLRLTDGRIYVGGDFARADGQPAGGLIRLRADLGLDATFSVGVGFNAPVLALAVDGGGGLLVGGLFQRFGTAYAVGLVRLGADGVRDTTFGASSGGGFGTVRLIRSLPDGKIVIAGGIYYDGSFSSPRGFVLRLLANGEVDSTWNLTSGSYSGPDGPVLALHQQSDGSWLVGGAFNGSTQMNGRLTRLTSNGSRDVSFTPDASLSTATEIAFITEVENGKFLIAGPDLPLSKITAAGARDTTLPAAPFTSAAVSFATTDADGAKRLWGAFTGASRVTGFTVLAANGASFGPVRGQPARAEAAIFEAQNIGANQVLVRGNFTHVDDVPAGGLARLSASGSVDSSFNAAVTLGTADTGRIAVQGDGKILVHNGTTLVRLHAGGTLDSSFGPVSYAPADLTLDHEGRPLIANVQSGGVFGGTTGVRRLTASGALDPSFTTTVTGYVRDMIVQPSGRILLGGPFGSVNSVSSSGPVRVFSDGTRDPSFSLGYITGYRLFGAAAGQIYLLASGVGRLTADGASDGMDYYSQPPAVAILPLPDGRFLRASNPGSDQLTQVLGRHLATGPLDTMFQHSGLNGARAQIKQMLLMDDGAIWLIGTNLSASGIPRFGLMRLAPAFAAGIATPPVSVQRDVGGSATFSVGTTGTGPITFQWYRNGMRIPGATQASLTVSNLSVFDVASYVVVVTNPYGSVTSTPVTISGPNPPPAISTQPQSQLTTAGSPATFAVAATGTGALTYQWRRSGHPIAGATGATFTIPRASRSDAGNYDVLVADGLSVRISVGVKLDVAPRSYPNNLALDPTFPARFERPGGKITGILAVDGGKFIVSGNFSRVGGTERPGLARVDAGFNVDSSFVPGISFSRQSSAGLEGIAIAKIHAVQPDGKLLVTQPLAAVGSFTYRNTLVRLMPSGAIDPAFNASSEPLNIVQLALQPDGKIIVIGQGLSSGLPAGKRYVYRLNADGSLDEAYAPVFANSSTASFAPSSVVVQSDGKAIFTGGFQSVNGTSVSSPARLTANGAIDSSFALTGISVGSVGAMARLPDDRLLVAGSFGSFGDTRVMRTTRDGAWEASLATSLEVIQWISSLNVQPNGKIWAATVDSSSVKVWRISAAGGVERQFYIGATGFSVAFAPLGDDGVLAGTIDYNSLRTGVAAARFAADATRSAELRIESEGGVDHVAFADGGKIFVGGGFSRVNGVPWAGLARLNGNGSLDSSFVVGDGFDDAVTDVLPLPNGRVVVCGAFTLYRGAAVAPLIRLMADGAPDPSFIVTVPQFSPAPVGQLSLLADGRILIDGSRCYLSDGSRDTGFSTALAGQAIPLPDGDVLIGIAGGSAVARLRPDGTTRTSGGSGMTYLRSIALLPDGRVFAGGAQSFSSPVPGVRRLTTSLSRDTTFATNGLPVPQYTISSYRGPQVIAQEDGRVIVNDLYGFSRLNADGTRDAQFVVPDLWVYLTSLSNPRGVAQLMLQDDGSVLMIEPMMSIGGFLHSGMFRFIDAALPAIASHPEDRIAVAGEGVTFTTAASGTGPFTYQWFRNGSPIAGATAATLALSNLTDADAGAYTVTVTNAGGTIRSNAGFLSLTPGVAPQIAAQPRHQSTTIGGNVVFAVNATGAPAPEYQWHKDDVAIPGATLARLAITGVRLEDAGSYTVRVSNRLGAVMSARASLFIVPVGVSAAHVSETPQWAPGGTVRIANTFTYSGSAPGLTWQVLLPTGWTIAATSGDEAATRPSIGTQDLAEWSWPAVTPSPHTFSYTLSAPPNAGPDAELAALVTMRATGDPVVMLAQPDPLILRRNHSADANADNRVSLLELTRVIELYNTRNGSARTGCYAVAVAASEDGFTPEPTRAGTGAATLARYHSADSNRDGRLALLELTRVIELYNYRSGTTRTGQYHVQPGTEDGFAPGP